MEDIEYVNTPSNDISHTVVCLSPEYPWMNLKQKHKDELLLAIYRKDGISHSELADELKISPSGLNAVVNKVCEDCEPQESPLEFTKVNKFKYYRLTDSGRQYVERNLLPAEGKSFEDDLVKYLELLQARGKQKPNGDLDEMIDSLLEQYGKMDEIIGENQNLLYGFMDKLFEYYLAMPANALKALEHLVESGEIKDKIKSILFNKHEERNRTAPLQKMMDENPEEAYGFADFVMEHVLEQDNANVWNLNMQYGWEILKPIIQKVEADMLRALVHFKDAQYLKRLWVSDGMDMHLAYYLAEKYRFMLLKYEQERGRKEKC